MRKVSRMLAAIFLSGALVCGCGGGSSASTGTTTPPAGATPAATPTMFSSNAQNGAEVVRIAGSTPGSTIYYTTDGSTPTTSSQIYQAPFLVWSTLTVKAIATAPGYATSAVNSFISKQPNVSPQHASVERRSSRMRRARMLSPMPRCGPTTPGNNGFGNNELENYCGCRGLDSQSVRCGKSECVHRYGRYFTHIVARKPSARRLSTRPPA